MSNGQKKNKIFTLVTSLVIVVLTSSFFMSCSSKNSAISEDKGQIDNESKGDELKKISSLKIDDSGSVITVQSTSRLTYSLKKIEDKHGLEIYLPKTIISEKIDREIRSQGIAENIIIEDSKEDQSSIIKINAKSDFEHSIIRESDNSIKINLKSKNIAVKTEKAIPSADKLLSIKTENNANGLRISLIGNGKIDNYKKSVIDKPNPRIVFDIYNITSDAKKEKKVPVSSPLADTIRYYNYTDYVRVVIDSKAMALRSFSDTPTSDGLIIDIGKTGVGASTTSSSGGQSASISKVEKIDISSDSSGKSTLQVVTSSPAKYDVIPSGKKIEISIKNASLAAAQQKPVISSKFDSAVEKVIPNQKNLDAALVVEMREQVPYRVEQNGNIISVYFEKGTSSIALNAQSASKSSLKVPTVSTSDAKPISPKVLPVKLSSNIASGSKTSQMTKEEDLGFDIGDTKKNYIGEKIALDFFETDIRNVFRIIQTVSKKNFAIDSDVKGRVTMRMDEPVPWDQVLDLVLKMNGLGMVHEAEIIRIATLERLKKEEEMRSDVLKAKIDKEKQQKAADPLFTEYITVNYSNAKKEVLPHLKSVITDKRGTISVDERNNQIIITDTKEKIAKAKEIIKSIDKVTPQVIIEARVVEATNTVSREIGTTWSANDTVGVTGKDDTIFTYAMGATNLPANSSGVVDLKFTRIAGNNMILNARLEAFESTGDIKIISSPKILTLDNKEAKIEQGVEYPYLKEIDEDGKATYELKPLTLNLTVKPHVTPDNRIAMTIVIKKDDVGDEIIQSTSGLAGQTKTFARSFLKKEATTELLVDDGETVVIGGIVKTRTEDASQSVPYLSKIPVLGWLFKNKISDNERSELLLFITPRIVQLEQKG